MSRATQYIGLAMMGAVLLLGGFALNGPPGDNLPEVVAAGVARGPSSVPSLNDRGQAPSGHSGHLVSGESTELESSGGQTGASLEHVLEGITAELLEHDTRAPVVLGVFLDRKTSYELRTHPGMERFLGQFAGMQDFTLPVQDVTGFWKQMEGRDLQEREALLRVTDGVIRASGDDSLKARLLLEFDEHIQEVPGHNSGARTDYAEKALQAYLHHAQSTPEWESELEKRGIPVLFVPPRVSGESGSAREESQ